jgi:hypothetical protein
MRLAVMMNDLVLNKEPQARGGWREAWIFVHAVMIAASPERFEAACA